jgi:tetratricopeptide (TPR) repeat protein
VETAVTDKLSESRFYYDQAQAHWRAGSLDLAISCFEECVRIGYPYFKGPSLVNLASIFGSIGDKERQLEYLRKVAALPDGESKFVPHAVLAQTLTTLHEYDRAADAYQRALGMETGHPATILNFAELQLIRRRLDSAAELLSRLEGSADPKVVLLSAFLQLVLAALRQRDRDVMPALTKFLVALRSNGLPPDLRWDFSDISPTLANITEPNNSAIINRLIDLLSRKTNVEEFLREFSGILPEK